MLWDLPLIKERHCSKTFDVAVVGASTSGLLCAHLLADEGLTVALLERSAYPGAGDSGRAPLSCTLGLSDNIWRLSQSLGKDRVSELLNIQEKGRSWLKRKQLLSSKGSYHLALSDREEQELFQSAELLQQLGFEAKVCSAEQCSEELGAELSFGGYHRTEEGVLSSSSVFSELLSSVNQVDLFPQTTLLEIERSSSGSSFSLLTNRTPLKADLVVICAGLGSRQLDSFFTERLSSVRSQYTAFQAPQKVGCDFVEAQFGHQQWFKHQNSLVFSGCRWATPHLEMGEEEEILSPEVAHAQNRIVRKLYPSSGPIQKQWSTLQTHTCDGLPFVGGLVGRDILMTLCGFQGKQAPLGMGCALTLCEALIGNGHIPYWLQARRF